MIGENTGKIINYAVRSKTCRICSASSTSLPRQHDCRQNHTGSAKSMEPEMVISMVEDNKSAGIHTESIVADDDTTTISRLRSEVDPSIKKQSDKNHVRKNFSNSLYHLQSAHKSLTSKVIKYLQKCFNYAVSQNRGNADGLSQALSTLSKHPFGEHDDCDSMWCKFKANPKSKHNSLPFGKPLADKSLQLALEKVIGTYRKNAGKLASLGSTQSNESFNRIVASKAPKAGHFSGSANLNYRVAAGVAQKNEGHQYVMKVRLCIQL